MKRRNKKEFSDKWNPVSPFVKILEALYNYFMVYETQIKIFLCCILTKTVESLAASAIISAQENV